MKRVVVYQSNTGFTRQYAEWIAEELKCEAINIKKASADMIASQDQVIFGGWIFANKISGFDKLKEMNPKKLVVFAVGATEQDSINLDQLKIDNQLGDTPLFYMQGGVHFEKLNFLFKGMLKMVTKASKKQSAPDGKPTMDLTTTFDCSDRNFIAPLITSLQS